MDYHTGGKWLTHGSKHRKENKLLKLKHSYCGEPEETALHKFFIAWKNVTYVKQLRNYVYIDIFHVYIIISHDTQICCMLT